MGIHQTSRVFFGFFFGVFFRRFFIDVVSLTVTMKGLGLLFVVVMVSSGDKPYLIEDGTCNDINHRPCCKRLIELYQKNLESQNRFEYPKCRPDGYYESKQCTDERETPTGWLADCTCVDENGEELLKLDDSYALCPIKADKEDTSEDTDDEIRDIEFYEDYEDYKNRRLGKEDYDDSLLRRLGKKAGVTENMGMGPQFVDNLKPIMDNLKPIVDNLKSIMDTNPSLKSAIQQYAGVTENMGMGPQFVDNLKPSVDTNPSPKSAIQQSGQLMLTWMKTTIETLMKLELELEHGAHGPSKSSSS